MEHDNETTYAELLAAIKPARTPSWRTMLRDRRAARAALVLFDKLAEREARAAFERSQSAATVRPPRGGSK